MEEATQQLDAPLQTESPAVENQGNDDAALLSAFLTAQEQADDHSDSEAGNPASQADEQNQQPSDVFTVKVNGTEKQVTRDELIANFQKGEASNQRFEEAANLRKEAEALRENFQSQQYALQNALNNFQQIAQQWASEGQPNWQELLDNNPHEYLRQKEMWQARSEQVQKAQAAQAYLQQQQQQQQQVFMQQHLQQESQKLFELIPEWKDEGKRVSEEKDLIDFLTKQGYSRDDLINLNQSRASNIKLAIDAMRYSKLVEQAKQSGKRVQGLPPRVERPGVATNQSGSREAYNRLGKTGSLDDAAAAFAELFG
ncbi:MAG: hypothetical protein RL563_1095 [Pseudomonadota bacterium]|jgi:hypothetical protein